MDCEVSLVNLQVSNFVTSHSTEFWTDKKRSTLSDSRMKSRGVRVEMVNSSYLLCEDLLVRLTCAL